MRLYARTKVKFSKTLEPTAPDTRPVNRRRLRLALEHIASFRHAPLPPTPPGDTMQALAYIDTFRPAYPDWCREPSLCAGRGFCPRDPACNE